MNAHTFLTLAYIFYQLSSSLQCSFYPTKPPHKIIYCSGVEIVDLPRVDIETASTIAEIYIHATSMTCVDSDVAWMYGNLFVFGEEANAYWNCSCMYKWLEVINRTVEVTSDCLHSYSTVTESLSSLIESETVHGTTEVISSNTTWIETGGETSRMAAAIGAAGALLLLLVAPLGAIMVRWGRRWCAPACRYHRCAGCCRRSVGIEQGVANPNWRLSLDEISLDEFVQGVSEV